MSGLIRLREGLHNRLLKLRSIEAMVAQPSFARLWNDSTEEMRTKLQVSIDTGDRQAVANWIKQHPSLELGERSLTELKRIARDLRIPNYSRLGKPQLIHQIQECESGTQ